MRYATELDKALMSLILGAICLFVHWSVRDANHTVNVPGANYYDDWWGVSFIYWLCLLAGWTLLLLGGLRLMKRFISR